MEPDHLAALTPEQRADLRLWHGRVNLLDRVKAMRGYTLLTVWAACASIAALVVGVNEMPPLVVAPVVPLYMGVKLRRRARSLRESGLRMRRVLLSIRAKNVIQSRPSGPIDRAVAKLASRELLESPYGAAIRRAVEDRTAILEIWNKLSKRERGQLPELQPTVNGLVERVASLAGMTLRLDQSIDPRIVEEIDARIAAAGREVASPDVERRLSVLRRQRATYNAIVQRRALVAQQLDNVGLALGSLRLDLINLRSSGLQSALVDVSTATQEARALSRDIGAVLDAAAEVQKL